MAVLRAKDQHMDVAAWLKGLGLERYEAAFRDNEIDRQVLTSLTADDLKEIDRALAELKVHGGRMNEQQMSVVEQ